MRKHSKEAAREKIELGTRKLEVNPRDVVVLSGLAVTYANAGEESKALEAAARVTEIDPNDGGARYNCAGTCACLGMREKALNYLERAFQAGTTSFYKRIRGDPSLENIRSHPKFKEILSKYSV